MPKPTADPHSLERGPDLRDGLILLAIELDRRPVMALLAGDGGQPADADSLTALLWCGLRDRDDELAEAASNALEAALPRSRHVALARRLQAVNELRRGEYDLADKRLLAAAHAEDGGPDWSSPSLAALAALLLSLGDPADSYASLERVFTG